MEALVWVAALALATSIAFAAGMILLPAIFIATCTVMMGRVLRESGDILDARAAFFLAVILFVGIPDVVLAAEFGRYGEYWRSIGIPKLIISREDFETAQLVVAAGLGAATIAILLTRPAAQRGAERTDGPPGRVVWLIYGAALVPLVVATVRTFRTPLGYLLFVMDPARRAAESQGSGIGGVLVPILTTSAYYASRLVRRPSVRVLLFVPSLLFVLPGANRGSLIGVLLIAAVAVNGLRVRRPFAAMVAGTLLLPLMSGALLVLRRAALAGGSLSLDVAALYRGFADEAIMVPMLAYVLRAMREHVVSFTYALDLLAFPLWFVPRVLWPSKPYPLDFRLNAALGLNDGVPFGSPVSLFGGMFLNFTWLGYLPAMAVFALAISRAYRSVRHDRLVVLLLFVFVVDIVRVGDLSRELLTFSISLIAVALVRWLALPPRAPSAAAGAAPVVALAGGVPADR